MDQLIRRQVTADRGPEHVTTNAVMACIRQLPDETFSTHDVVAAIQAQYPTLEFYRLEYSVRSAVAWLCKRGDVKITSATVKRYTRSNKPYWATVYLRIERMWPCDCALLNRILIHAETVE